MTIPIIGHRDTVEIRMRVSRDVAVRIATDQQRTGAMIMSQSAVIAAIVAAQPGRKIDLTKEEHEAGLSYARRVGAAYHPDGSVTLSIVGEGEADGEGQGSSDGGDGEEVQAGDGGGGGEAVGAVGDGDGSGPVGAPE